MSSSSDGLHPHKKTITCDESRDYALHYFQNIPQWKNPVQVLPREVPWICPEREGSSSSWNKLSSCAKYLNYEMSPRFIDLDDPFVVQKFNDIRRIERFDPSKKKKNKRKEASDDVFQTVQPKEGVGDNAVLDEEDDFLDEYGNVRDEAGPSRREIKKAAGPKRAQQTEKVPPCSLIQPIQPRKSFLSKEEQKNYLPLYIRFWEKPMSESNIPDRRSYSLFSHYIETVRNEQIEFANHAKSIWYEAADHRKNHVLREDVRHFVDSYYEIKIREILSKYPQCYADTKKFIRCSPSVPTEEFDFTLESNLLELGVIPKIILPTQQSLFHNVKITTGPEKMKELLAKKKGGHLALSEDPNIDILARTARPDIVVSSNPLKTIFNNFGPCYDRRWCVPLVVKRIESKLVYFFEKSLPDLPPLSTVKKKTVFIKVLGKRFLIHPWTQSSRPSTTPHHSEEETEEESLFGDVGDHTLSESFGESISQVDGNEEMMEDKAEASSLLGSILESQKDAHKTTEEFKRPPNLQITSQYDGAPIDRTQVGAITDFSQPPKGNLVYNLWRLKKKKNNNSEPIHSAPPGLQGGLKVLVRCSIHGIRPVGKKKTHKIPEVMTLSTKLENQWAFGAEVATKSERAKDWISTYIRPGSLNCRLRVRHGYEVCTCEIKSLPDLTHDANGLDFIPTRQLGNLHEVFDGVLKTVSQEGTYLLLHDENSGPFLRLYKSQEGGTTLDLRSRLNLEDYKADRAIAIKGIPWIPLDFNIVTPWHKRNNRVPGLFEPCPSFQNNRKRKRGSSSKNSGHK